MRLATKLDRPEVVDILTASFDQNKSVNYIIPQDKKRKQRLRRLMEHSFDYCLNFGKVYLSDDSNGCALLVLPDRKKTSLAALLLDLKLIFPCICVQNVKKT